MQENDTFTISIKKAPNSAFMKAFEKDWLGYLGFSKKELNTLKEISLILKASKNALIIKRGR